MTNRDAASPGPAAGGKARLGEPRLPMALAVLATAGLRATLPPQLRAGDARWLFPVVVAALLFGLIIGDPGRIDRQSTRLRIATGILIGVISLANASSAVRLVDGIVGSTPFTENARVLLANGAAVWIANVISFALWYWDLDQGGAAARARGSGNPPAFVFPEMENAQYVKVGWYPRFVDYLHLSFNSATAFSPADVSPIRPWAKLMMMLEEAISLTVALLVVARAVNILK